MPASRPHVLLGAMRMARSPQSDSSEAVTCCLPSDSQKCFALFKPCPTSVSSLSSADTTGSGIPPNNADVNSDPTSSSDISSLTSTDSASTTILLVVTSSTDSSSSSTETSPSTTGPLTIPLASSTPTSVATSTSSSSTSPTSSLSTPIPPQAVSSSSSNTPQTAVSNHTGAIAGGIIGAFLFLCLIIFALFLFLRRRRTAPSSKFSSKSRFTARFSRKPKARLSSFNDLTSADPFAAGDYTDPLFEKLHNSASRRLDGQTAYINLPSPRMPPI